MDTTVYIGGHYHEVFEFSDISSEVKSGRYRFELSCYDTATNRIVYPSYFDVDIHNINRQANITFLSPESLAIYDSNIPIPIEVNITDPDDNISQVSYALKWSSSPDEYYGIDISDINSSTYSVIDSIDFAEINYAGAADMSLVVYVEDVYGNVKRDEVFFSVE